MEFTSKLPRRSQNLLPSGYRHGMRRLTIQFIVLTVVCFARASSAQITPAAGYTPPDDTPSIKVGATIFANYIYQQNPTIVDADGNTVNRSAFDVSRAYINV